MTRTDLNALASLFRIFASLTDKLPPGDKEKVWDAFTAAMGLYLQVTEGEEG